MSDPRSCPACGSTLPTDAPEGLCPGCLLQKGLALSSDNAPNSAASTALYQGRFSAPLPAELAPLFPQLEILELLGQGGMGAVYKARQPKLDRLVALKILPRDAGRDPRFAERFLREARALAKLDHPHIVGVHDFGEADGLPYFLMEFVDGVNLRQVMRSGRLPPEQALAIVPQICEALQYAHEEGVIHRDIKPENILLDKKGRVRIADFGLAKLLDRDAADLRLTATHQAMGTPHYMAPEQMEKPLEVDHRADIYSLGVVFYEMLTGELPLGRFAPPSQMVPVDVRLDEIVLRALEKNPDHRYQHVSEVKTEMELLRGETAPPRQTAAVPLPPRAPGQLDKEMQLLLMMSLVYSVLGALSSFWLPWSETKISGHASQNGRSMSYKDNVSFTTYGIELWQGQVSGGLCLGLCCLVFGTVRLGVLVWWRALTVIATCAVLLGISGRFLAKPSLPDAPDAYALVIRKLEWVYDKPIPRDKRTPLDILTEYEQKGAIHIDCSAKMAPFMSIAFTLLLLLMPGLGEMFYFLRWRCGPAKRG
jgi:serine/threonine protein kinase